MIDCAIRVANYMRLLTVFLLVFLTGCQVVNPDFDLADGKSSTNERYDEGDIIGAKVKI